MMLCNVMYRISTQPCSHVTSWCESLEVHWNPEGTAHGFVPTIVPSVHTFGCWADSHTSAAEQTANAAIDDSMLQEDAWSVAM